MLSYCTKHSITLFRTGIKLQKQACKIIKINNWRDCLPTKITPTVYCHQTLLNSLLISNDYRVLSSRSIFTTMASGRRPEHSAPPEIVSKVKTSTLAKFSPKIKIVLPFFVRPTVIHAQVWSGFGYIQAGAGYAYVTPEMFLPA